MIGLKTPLSQFPTVKKGLLVKLCHLGLKTAADLLFYFPFRYEDFRAIVPIAKIQPDQPITVRGRLELIANKRSSWQRRFLTEALVADSTGRLKVIWFNQPYLAKVLKAGDKLSLAGRVELNRFGLAMVNPIFEKDIGIFVHTSRLVPNYPTTSGLTQKQLRFLIKTALPAAAELKEWLPKEIIKRRAFPSLERALREIHFSEGGDLAVRARERFQFEELFLIQLRAELWRRELIQLKAPEIVFKEKETRQLVAGLPFQLTNGQRQAAWEILKDLGKGQPMNRLLDGDVGSGKTIVAAIASYNAVLNGYQAAFMAPTEILAQQHWQNLNKIFAGFGLAIGLLTGGAARLDKSEAKRQEFLNSLKGGAVRLVIGTHALIQEKVVFKNLGLVIVDEQHRFGVGQRRLLRNKSNLKGLSPHFLSLTATPIPRSYALALYGDLDLSLIKEMPPGRRKIITKLAEEANRQKAYEFIRRQIASGRQAFVICPLIEIKGRERGGLFNLNDKKSVLAEYERLAKEIFPDLKMNYLHGRMKADEKEKIMRDFLEKKFDILVSTSVVEVGVDIPNATVMMIEGAERFGLAQLHQFRGRVGRSEHQSYCFLFAGALGETAKKRLEYFAVVSDGFALAEKDLELRGPGEIFGTTQHGFPELKIANLQNMELIKKSREAARELLEKDSHLTGYPLLKEKIKEWEEKTHLE